MFEHDKSFQYSHIISMKNIILVFLTVPMEVKTPQVNPRGGLYIQQKAFRLFKRSKPLNMMSLYVSKRSIIPVLLY